MLPFDANRAGVAAEARRIIEHRRIVTDAGARTPIRRPSAAGAEAGLLAHAGELEHGVALALPAQHEHALLLRVGILSALAALLALPASLALFALLAPLTGNADRNAFALALAARSQNEAVHSALASLASPILVLLLPLAVLRLALAGLPDELPKLRELLLQLTHLFVGHLLARHSVQILRASIELVGGL